MRDVGEALARGPESGSSTCRRSVPDFGENDPGSIVLLTGLSLVWNHFQVLNKR